LDFENRDHLFAALHTKTKFCILGLSLTSSSGTKACAMATQTSHLSDPRRIFELTRDDLQLLNPNTLTCPLFRSAADAELTRRIYRCVPVLIRNASSPAAYNNDWGLEYRCLFHMSSDSDCFQYAPSDGLVPLYEAKMIWHYDHRWAFFTSGDTSELSGHKRAKPDFQAFPRYWVSRGDIDRRIPATWQHQWLLGFRDITDTRNERSVVCSVIPRSGVGHTLPLVFTDQPPSHVACLLATWCSLICDYVARQKIGGLHLTYSYLNQLPVLGPDAFDEERVRFIVPRVFFLTYTAWDIKAFADDLWKDSPELTRASISAYAKKYGALPLSAGSADRQAEGVPFGPFAWSDEVRLKVRAELDAYFFHLYGCSKRDLAYVMDPTAVMGASYPSETFRVLKLNEEQRYGEFRTARLIGEAWDRLAPTWCGTT
jgi:hypothetical protein